jgi:hypothetical protein
MGTFFAGLGVSLALLAAALKVMKQAKRTNDKPKQGKLYRVAAILMLLAGCAAIGTNFSAFATTLASKLPGPLIAFAAVFCALGVFFDCIGKENFAGKGTVWIALITPLLLVTAPLSVFGIDPGQIVRDVRSVTTEANVVRANGMAPLEIPEGATRIQHTINQ